jgi:ferric-dicitrate binding protein FerR (iron transport regulator)
MPTREEHERQTEALRLWWRRIMYLVVLAVAAGLAVWFVRWVSGGVGLDRIGEHYKQADEF